MPQRSTINMASDYATIRAENERRYGTDIGRIGPMLLAERYDDRTHFIFELLQNAEDALGRREGWEGSRAVSFALAGDALRIEHFGMPFDARDVRSICGIAESTKELTAIGRFGIGFKSVYAVTERPEIHSGDEAFAIESFVLPVAVPAVARDPEVTVVQIPLTTSVRDDRQELARGLSRLDRTALLFLREIEEIRWTLDDGRSGIFLRESNAVGEDVRRVTVVGQEYGQQDAAEEWLIFSRAVSSDADEHAGYVELAFSLEDDGDDGQDRVRPIDRSPLVVFFPTVVETYLGFLIQGPYRTTPSRDNVPRGDAWNRHLTGETAALLRAALVWLRDNRLLDTRALQCLPLDPTKFGESNMFAPLYEAGKAALIGDALLPRFDVGYVTASVARLGRTTELRDLLTPPQLGMLYGEDGELVWLSGEITQDRAPQLRRYLMQELEISEVTPELAISQLDKRFLEAQTDDWLVRLYGFLNGQPGLRRRLEALPLVRLEDGSHVPVHLDGQPQAFLPGPIASGFPLVHAGICAHQTALEFLQALGLTQPDPVDDVIRNVLPRYQVHEIELSEADYEADIIRILHAFGTDSKGQREKLVAALRETNFVMVVDSGTNEEFMATPEESYLSTERFRGLFAEVPGVLLTDDQYACLRGERVRELLEGCGALRYLRPIPDDSLTGAERSELRVRAGKAETSWRNDRVTDWALLGLDALLTSLPRLSSGAQREKARLIWEELASLEERRGKGVFTGDYTWTYYGPGRAVFDAHFVRALNGTRWVPDENGQLQLPELVLFESLGWNANPFLETKIRFKPPILDQLAKEAGIEPGLLDLLKKLGVTSEAELRARLGEVEGAVDRELENSGASAVDKGHGFDMAPKRADLDPSSPDIASSRQNKGGGEPTDRTGAKPDVVATGGQHDDVRRKGQLTRDDQPGGGASRPAFISYVAVDSAEREADPDGLSQASRMALESQAIDFILSHEPAWQRTTMQNPGFDLLEAGPDGQPVRWCEVKAMTGSLADRPIGLSRAQFDTARDRSDAYWLYVVEQAGTDQARIVRIQDPAGKARTFSFDRGWLDVAVLEADGPAHPGASGS